MSFEKHSTSDVDQNNIVQGARQRAPSFKTVGSPGEEGFTAEKQLEGRHKGGAKDDAKAGGKGGKGAKRDAPGWVFGTVYLSGNSLDLSPKRHGRVRADEACERVQRRLGQRELQQPLC